MNQTNSKSTTNPICPKCNIPFAARIKKEFTERLFFRKHEAKKYWCQQCDGKYLIVQFN